MGLILYYLLYPFIKLKEWDTKMKLENARMEKELEAKMIELAKLRIENATRERALIGKGIR